jgi:hypothetical protein
VPALEERRPTRPTYLSTVADVDPWLVCQVIVETAISDGEWWMGHDSLWLSPEAISARLAAAAMS